MFRTQSAFDFDPHGYLQHILAYGVGMFIGLKLPVKLTGSFVVFWGVLIEFVQYFIPYRSFNFFDIMANISGAVLVLLIYVSFFMHRSNGLAQR